MDRNNHPVDPIRNKVFLRWWCCQRLYVPYKTEKNRLLVIIHAWNSTQMNNNRKKLDEPMWFEVAIYSATGSTIVLIQSGLWFFSDDKDQLLCRWKCLTTHEDMIPSNKTMLRGEYVQSVPFWWGFNSLRLWDKFVFKIEIFKVWIYAFSWHISTRSMQKKLLFKDVWTFSLFLEYSQNTWLLLIYLSYHRKSLFYNGNII